MKLWNDSGSREFKEASTVLAVVLAMVLTVLLLLLIWVKMTTLPPNPLPPNPRHVGSSSMRSAHAS
jgi:hypothetical protein|tara:strand:- start:203 stop:400 length:198 start_codon:yes stop_codon:yes gene_type:complete